MLKLLGRIFTALGAILLFFLILVVIFGIPAALISAAIHLFKTGFIFFGSVVCLVGVGIIALIGSIFN